jgi:hypothetical protein
MFELLYTKNVRATSCISYFFLSIYKVRITLYIATFWHGEASEGEKRARDRFAAYFFCYRCYLKSIHSAQCGTYAVDWYTVSFCLHWMLCHKLRLVENQRGRRDATLLLNATRRLNPPSTRPYQNKHNGDRRNIYNTIKQLKVIAGNTQMVFVWADRRPYLPKKLQSRCWDNLTRSPGLPERGA